MIEDDDRTAFYNAMWECLDADDLFAKTPPGKVGGFGLGKRIILPSVADLTKLPSVHFDYSKADKVLTRIRLEFVPVDLGADGMEELDAAITTFIDGGWQYVVANGHITRLDVAVDIGIKTGSFLFMPKQSATTTQWQFNGELESYYSGKSKGNQTKIYDRRKKRLAKGQNFPDASTRLERRLVSLKGLKMIDLPSFANPFDGIKLLDNPLHPPPWFGPHTQWEWQLFCDAVVVRGLTDALAILPLKKREKYRAYIKTQDLKWWQPKILWKGWTKMLHELKLCN